MREVHFWQAVQMVLHRGPETGMVMGVADLCFLVTLSAPTTESIEARICLYDTSRWDDLAVEFLELYVK